MEGGRKEGGIRKVQDKPGLHKRKQNTDKLQIPKVSVVGEKTNKHTVNKERKRERKEEEKIMK